ncbi:MAG: glycosyltransferase [Sphingobacteriales bacterium]|nr:MAG: glycosyltransferase [Sphingobacteriales bacterium]
MPRKTLLFHVSNFLTGGIEKVLLELLRGLVAKGRYRIILVIAHDLRDAEKLLSQLPEQVAIRRVLDKRWHNRVRYQKMTGYLHPVEKAVWELFLPRVIRRQHLLKYRQWQAEADVIIDFDATLAPYISHLKNTRTAAYCHFAFSALWDGQKTKRDRLVRRLMQYDRVVMLCDEMKAEAAQLYPALEEKLFRIYNALDVEKVQQQSSQWPAEWAYLQHEPYLVSVGRLTEHQKDFTTVIKAYAAAVREQPFPERLVIVGEGGDREALEQLAAAEGVRDRILFTGFQPNPYPFIAAAKTFLFGSKFEGLPTVLIEAHVLKTPVIATECPTGVRELLADGTAGILVPMGDVTGMKEGLLKLLFNPLLRTSLLTEADKLLPQFHIEYALEQFERAVIGKG